MNQADVANLEHGVYLVRWKSGGASVASVGSLHSGERWLAPANWTSSDEGGVFSAKHWDDVESMTPIALNPYDGDFQDPRALGRASAFEEAAKHLEEHAQGYENSAKSTGEHIHEGTYEGRRRDEAIAYSFREKATQIRQMK